MLANRCDRRNRAGEPQHPRGPSLILVTFYPQCRSGPTRTRARRHAPIRSRISSPARRVCPPAAVCSKVSHTNIYGEFGASSHRLFVLCCCPVRIGGPVLVYRCDGRSRAGGPQYLRRRSISATAWQQTGECGRGEAWRRTIADLLSGEESMPSNSRVIHSSPHLHLRRVWREQKILVRLKSLSGAHRRTRTCVPL